MRIYLDSCSLLRLIDDPSQERVRKEADAVEAILHLVRNNRLEWVVSVANVIEVHKNPDEIARADALALLALAGSPLHPDTKTMDRARALAKAGYGAFDALHLACAELALVDALLTTDDRFQRLADRGVGDPEVCVMNPINWLGESVRWPQ